MHDVKAIYFFIPKVACTTLKKAAGQIIGIPECMPLTVYQKLQISLKRRSGKSDESYHWVHYPFITDATLFDDYFKFCFVRNPWDRLVSCYYNKVKSNYSGFSKYQINSEMSFEQFAKTVCDIPDSDAESHFQSQTYIIKKAGDIDMDFIGKFETLNSDFNYVCKKLGVNKTKLPKMMTSPRPQSNYKTHYKDNLVELVRERYKNDCVKLEYSF